MEEHGHDQRWVGCYGASLIERAPAIVILPGTQFTAADIIVFPQEGFSVERFVQTEDGTALDLQGEFLTFLSTGSTPFPVRKVVDIEPNGFFRARGLPVGDYLVVSIVRAQDGPGWKAEQELQITGHTNVLRILLRRATPEQE